MIVQCRHQGRVYVPRSARRRAYRIWCLVAAAWVLSGVARAAGRLELEQQLPPAWRSLEASFTRFTDELEALIPPEFAHVIGEPVRLTFDYGPALRDNDLLDSCRHPERQTTAEALSARLATVSESPLTVRLNPRLADAVIAGPAAAMRLPRFHGDCYRLAMAATLHQLTLICERRRPGGPLAATTEFRKLIGWHDGWFSGDLKNRNLRRSPDPYETLSPTAFLAVNMEYFLLDPDYGARRPAVCWFLSRHFRDPWAGKRRAPSTEIYLANSRVKVSLDPANVHAIHYLLAARGAGMAAGFGHSLLRLVIAPPGQAPGGDPMTAVHEHVVLAYQALTLGDLTIDHIGGLMGKYPSQLFAYLFTTVQSRYVAGEFRALRSVPLDLSPEQRTLLVYKLLENYWQYSGSYRFFTRNCATETRDDIQAALFDGHPFQNSDARTPGGIARVMRHTGLLDESVFDDLDVARRRGYYFPDLGLVEASFKRLTRRCPTLRYRNSVSGYLKHSDAAYRRQAYSDLLTADLAENGELAADCYTIETRIRTLAYRDLVRRAVRLIRRDRRRRGWAPSAEYPSPGALCETFERAEQLLTELMPWNMLPDGSGYGIPLPAERRLLPSDAEIRAREKELQRLRDRVVTALRADSPALCARYDDAGRNARFFASEGIRFQPGRQGR